MADSPEPSANTDGSTAPAFSIGDMVHDREDDDPNDALVVNLPSKPATEWIAYREVTVAEDNPDYPADARVVVVVFAEELSESFSQWEGNSHLPLERIDKSDASHYSFPAPRLTVVDSSTPTSESSPAVAESADAGNAASDESTTTADERQEPATVPATDSATDSATDEDRPPATEADLSESMRTLKERLEDGGVTVEIEPDGQALSVTKLGDSYRVRPARLSRAMEPCAHGWHRSLPSMSRLPALPLGLRTPPMLNSSTVYLRLWLNRSDRPKPQRRLLSYPVGI